MDRELENAANDVLAAVEEFLERLWADAGREAGIITEHICSREVSDYMDIGGLYDG